MPASYPGAVKTFTNKSNGQTIEASHVTDLQDEVTAIESGLLNGTAPLTSSNAAVNALQVSSASTFAVRPVMPPPEAALVFLQSTAALSSAVSTVAWTGQAFVSNSSMHSTGSNPSRLVPQSTGFYEFAAQVAFSPNSSGNRSVSLLDSSGATIAATRAVAAGAEVGYVQVKGYKRFDALGGYAVVQVEYSAASTMSLSSGFGVTWFSMVKL